MVLLRGVDERGFVFHTNYRSRKAPRPRRQSLRGALLSLADARGTDSRRGRGHAPAARRVGRLLRRPPARKPARGVDLGAERDPRVARDSSTTQYAATEARFAGQPVPRPPFWGGLPASSRRASSSGTAAPTGCTIGFSMCVRVRIGRFGGCIRDIALTRSRSSRRSRDARAAAQRFSRILRCTARGSGCASVVNRRVNQ